MQSMLRSKKKDMKTGKITHGFINNHNLNECDLFIGYTSFLKLIAESLDNTICDCELCQKAKVLLTGIVNNWDFNPEELKVYE